MTEDELFSLYYQELGDANSSGSWPTIEHYIHALSVVCPLGFVPPDSWIADSGGGVLFREAYELYRNSWEARASKIWRNRQC